ncbi:uncharacterized protein LOC116290073 [Actinia tenebrosa]|uniref:Uncharacterized protein LOC116290073 n=1 Tax=Actinia tenebrosa TaxID=6105 RepID=A0A6P8HJZ6_ACTTE|nr:uncharacterized protein LOC116290073 [Actinia tenebrosa]
MAFNFRYTRYSAFCHLILGGLCIIFGIADRASMYDPDAFQTEGVIAIWMGAWFFMTGILGCFATQRIPNSARPNAPLVGTYLAFSIVGTVFAGTMIICYSIGIAIIASSGRASTETCNSDGECTWTPSSPKCPNKCRVSVGLGAMIIIFAVVEFGVGIWSSICCCMGYECCCCDTSTPQQMHQGQIVYLQTQGGPVGAYVMTQGPNGMPVAVPAMTGGPVYPAPNQDVDGQGYMMQTRPQGAMAVTPTHQVQGFPTSIAQQPVVTTQHAFNAPTTGYRV